LFAKTSEQSYVDLFPKERLVYLSPHAEHELLEDDEDNIYVIGGFVDTGRDAHRPLSYARAQKG
jgi:ribonuclease P protein 1